MNIIVNYVIYFLKYINSCPFINENIHLFGIWKYDLNYKIPHFKISLCLLPKILRTVFTFT